MKRIVSVLTLLAFAVFLTACAEKGVTDMTNPPIEEPAPIETWIDMTYSFEGAHSDDAGYAQGTITLTPSKEKAAKSGYYLLYFADDKGLLADYDEFAAVPITGEAVCHTVKGGTLLPPAATKLAVFESDTAFLDTQPDYTALAGLMELPTEKCLSLAEPVYTFGAISDVHMNYEAHNRGAYAKWKAALNFFAESGMDDVIVTGDMTGDEFEGTLDAQYQKYLELIAESDYPLENIFECIGNHGNTDIGREQFVTYTSGEGEVHPFEGSPWFYVLRKNDTRDNLFIFMAQELKAPGDSANYDNFSKEQIDWVKSVVEEFSDTNTNIFLIEHSPFLNYGPGDRHPGKYTGMVTFKRYYFQSIRLQKLLEAHKNIILMSGHSHLSLYDGENYSDEEGTSCRMIHLGSGCQPCAYDADGNLVRSYDGRYEVTPTYGSEAYTVAVYEDYIIYTGRNLSTGTVIPHACFILPIEAEG